MVSVVLVALFESLHTQSNYYFCVLLVIRTIMCTCTPSFVGIASLISEILFLFVCLLKQPKFPFGPWTIMDYSPWSSKNLIDRNRLTKFRRVGIDVKCMYIDFGGHDLFGFRDTVTFKNGQISLSDHGL